MQLSSVSKRQIDFPDGLFRTDDFCDFAVKTDRLTHWNQCLYRPFLKPRLEEKLVLTAKRGESKKFVFVSSRQALLTAKLSMNIYIRNGFCFVTTESKLSMDRIKRISALKKKSPTLATLVYLLDYFTSKFGLALLVPVEQLNSTPG